LQVSAALGAFLGEWQHAARLYGAAEAQKEQIGYHREPADEAFLEPFIARTRRALGESAFAPAEAAGRGLSYEGALSEARAWLEKPL
jgi:hypothetical protein